MPGMTKSYCKNTPIKRMGFSQRSSCKAQGLIKRTSRKLKGKYIVSPKYKENKYKQSKSKQRSRRVRKSKK